MKKSKLNLPYFFGNLYSLIAWENTGKQAKITLDVDGEKRETTPSRLLIKLLNWLDTNHSGPKSEYKTSMVNGIELPIEIHCYFVCYDNSVNKHVVKISYEWED